MRNRSTQFLAIACGGIVLVGAILYLAIRNEGLMPGGDNMPRVHSGTSDVQARQPDTAVSGSTETDGSTGRSTESLVAAPEEKIEGTTGPIRPVETDQLHPPDRAARLTSLFSSLSQHEQARVLQRCREVLSGTLNAEANKFAVCQALHATGYEIVP